MEEPKDIEKQEMSKEILSEWYKEKGVSPEEVEKEKKEEEKRQESREKEPTFSPSSLPPTGEDADVGMKKREEEKKLLVKNKIKYLLKVGEERGLEHSIKEAEKENNPFLLDIYHDVLAKDGAYKKFLKK